MSAEPFSYDNCSNCNICYAIVADQYWGEHLAYHQRQGDAAPQEDRDE